MERAPRIYSMILAVIIVFLPGCSQAADPVEKQSIPLVDGMLEEGEWKDAETRYFEDGSQLYLLRDRECLYLAIQGKAPGLIAWNVFLSDGERILIMHTSAALGTAAYQLKEDRWLKVKDFDWCCRSKFDTESSIQDRQDLYDREGWLGANSFLGTENQLEFKIRVADHFRSLAVNFLLADDPDQKLVWPSDLTDGVSQPTAGGFPEWMEFTPEEWFELEGIQ